MEDFEDLKRDIPKYPNQVLAFSVPVGPSVNHQYIPTKSGKKILTKEAKKYITVAQNSCRDEMKRVKWKKDNDNVWYAMELYFYFQDKRFRDSHNCLKLLLDSFEGLVCSNDYFLMPRIMRCELDRENPRIEIIITPERE